MNWPRYFGTKHAIGINSGTDGLWLPLMALGVGPGDEVITTVNTFFATAEAIWIAGAKAVFVDSEPLTNNIDPSKIEAAITPTTRKPSSRCTCTGSAPRWIRSPPSPKSTTCYVIEDCAQAIDAAGANFKIGELSDAVSTSFIIQKNLGTFGDGGAVMTNSDRYRQRNQAPAQPRLAEALRAFLRLQQPPG